MVTLEELSFHVCTLSLELAHSTCPITFCNLLLYCNAFWPNLRTLRRGSAMMFAILTAMCCSFSQLLQNAWDQAIACHSLVEDSQSAEPGNSNDIRGDCNSLDINTSEIAGPRLGATLIPGGMQ